MFRIPEFYEVEMSFDEAMRAMTRHGRGDGLRGMKLMGELWSDYCASDDQDDDKFFYEWGYELSAYNIVYEGMSELFAEAV
jgi:hypothetical protein